MADNICNWYENEELPWLILSLNHEKNLKVFFKKNLSSSLKIIP